MVFILVGSLFTGPLVLVHYVRITMGELLGLINSNVQGTQYLSHPALFKYPCSLVVSAFHCKSGEDAVKMRAINS